MANLRSHQTGRQWAIVSMLAGFATSVLTSTELWRLFRDELRYGCSFLRMGESDPGGFACADGVSYLGIAILIHGASALVMLAALLILFVWPLERELRSRLVGALALIPVAFFVALTVWGATHRAADAAPDADYWTAPMLPAAVLLGATIAVVVAASLTRRRLHYAGTVLAALLLVAAVVAQPGILPSAAMSLGLLGSALLLKSSGLALQRPGPPLDQDVTAG